MNNLNLNRDNLIPSVRRYFDLQNKMPNISDFEEKGGPRRRVTIIDGGISFYMDFHFNKSGTTSIDIAGGNLREVKSQIAQFIMEDPSCSIGDIHSKSKNFVASNINFQDFTSIVDLLKESPYYRAHNREERGHYEVHKFTGSYNDEFVAHYYYTTNKVMLQGRPLILFNEIVSYITELIDLGEIPKLFNTFYNVEIEKDHVESMYDTYFPNSCAEHPPKLKKVLHQGIYNLHLEGDMYDLSFLAFPGLRALEGHLKLIFSKFNIQLENNRFSMYNFDANVGKHKLDEESVNKIGDTNKIKYLERAYGYYNRNRHSLFHWGDPSNPIDQTRIIENMGEVKTLLVDTFQIIDEYYTI